MGVWVWVSFERISPFPVVPYVRCRVEPFSCLTARFSLVNFLLFLFHKLVEFMEIDIGKNWGDYTSYKVANMLVEFSTSIPRTQLRPGYGDGFLGAPLHTALPSEKPSPREQGGHRGTSSTHPHHTSGGAPHV